MKATQICFVLLINYTLLQSGWVSASEPTLIDGICYELTVDGHGGLKVRSMRSGGKPIDQVTVKWGDSELSGVRKAVSTRWSKSGLFIIAEVRLPKDFTHLGIAFGKVTAEDGVELDSYEVGEIFRSSQTYSIIQVESFAGDSICAFFGQFGSSDSGLAFRRGITYANACPLLASPGNLYRLSGEKIYSESDVIRRGQKVEAPFIEE